MKLIAYKNNKAFIFIFSFFLFFYAIFVFSFNLIAETTITDNNTDIFSMSLDDLAKIEVSIANLVPTDINLAPGVVTIVTREEIQRLNPRNVTDILNLTNEFNVVVEGLHAPLLQLRGTGNRQDHVLMLIDGHRLNSQLFGGITYVINDIPVEIIDRIEIIRGPGSAIYGSNAFEAVINLITLPQKNSEKGLVYSKLGSFDTYTGGINYKYKKNDYHIVLSASGYSTDGDDEDYTDRSAYKGKVNFWQRTNNIYAHINKGKLSLLAFRSEENDGPFIGISQYLGDKTDRKYTTTAIEGKYETDLGVYGALTAKLYYDQFDYDCFWENLPPRLYPPKGLLLDYTASDYRLGSELIWKKTFFENHNLLLGGNFDKTELFDTTIEQIIRTNLNLKSVSDEWMEPEENYHYSFFIQDQFKIFDKYHLTIGARFDDYDKYGNSFNPRLAISYPFGKYNHIKFLYGSAFRAPSYYESNTNLNGGLIPNPDVKPEQLETFEIEYGFHKNDVNFKINSFYTTITDLISTVSLPAGNTKMNAGDVETYGFGVELKKNFDEIGLSLTLNAYWNDSKDENGDRRIRLPHYGSVLIADKKWTKQLNTNIQFKYTGEMEKSDIYDKNGNILANVDDLPETLTCNLSVLYEFQKFTLKGLIYNIFDEPLYVPAPSVLNSENEPLANYPYHGRFAMIGVEFNF